MQLTKTDHNRQNKIKPKKRIQILPNQIQPNQTLPNPTKPNYRRSISPSLKSIEQGDQSPQTYFYLGKEINLSVVFNLFSGRLIVNIDPGLDLHHPQFEEHMQLIDVPLGIMQKLRHWLTRGSRLPGRVFCLKVSCALDLVRLGSANSDHYTSNYYIM